LACASQKRSLSERGEAFALRRYTNPYTNRGSDAILTRREESVYVLGGDAPAFLARVAIGVGG